MLNKWVNNLRFKKRLSWRTLKTKCMLVTLILSPCSSLSPGLGKRWDCNSNMRKLKGMTLIWEYCTFRPFPRCGFYSSFAPYKYDSTWVSSKNISIPQECQTLHKFWFFIFLQWNNENFQFSLWHDDFKLTQQLKN